MTFEWRYEVVPQTYEKVRELQIEAWWFLEDYDDDVHPCVEIRRGGIFIAPVGWTIKGEYGPYENVSDAKQACETALALNQPLFKT